MKESAYKAEVVPQQRQPGDGPHGGPYTRGTGIMLFGLMFGMLGLIIFMLIVAKPHG